MIPNIQYPRAMPIQKSNGKLVHFNMISIDTWYVKIEITVRNTLQGNNDVPYISIDIYIYMYIHMYIYIFTYIHCDCWWIYTYCTSFLLVSPNLPLARNLLCKVWSLGARLRRCWKVLAPHCPWLAHCWRHHQATYDKAWQTIDNFQWTSSEPKDHTTSCWGLHPQTYWDAS